MDKKDKANHNKQKKVKAQPDELDKIIEKTRIRNKALQKIADSSGKAIKRSRDS